MNSTRQKHTLKSVASLLGVSTATISNAFNRPSELSAAKRETILSACKEIGYSGPNRAAGSLRRGHTNIYGIILADTLEYMITDPVASEFMRGVSETLQDAKKHLLLFAGSEKNLDEVIHFVDGFICYGEPSNPELREQLKSLDKPIVVVDYSLPERPSVNIDNTGAAKQLLASVIQPTDRVAVLGLRLVPGDAICRLHMLPDFGSDNTIAYRRLAGYMQAASEANVTISGSFIWSIPQSTEKYAKLAAFEMFSSNPLPNLIVCMSDLLALTLASHCKEIGLRVPEDIRIIGFDGIQECFRSNPTLSTVVQPSAEKGRRAAQLLLSGEQETLLLPVELFQGESSANPN